MAKIFSLSERRNPKDPECNADPPSVARIRKVSESKSLLSSSGWVTEVLWTKGFYQDDASWDIDEGGSFGVCSTYALM